MKRDRILRRANGEHGQSLVELALTLPVLLLLLLGTIDFGLGYRTYIVLTNAAREGARSITIYPSNPSLATARIRAEAGTIGLVVEDDDISFSSSSPGPPYRAGDRVTVTVAYDYPLLFSEVLGSEVLGIDEKIEFSASSTMVVLYDE